MGARKIIIDTDSGLDDAVAILLAPACVAGTWVSQAIAALTAPLGRANPEKFGAVGVPLHDPCTIAWLLDPDLFSGRRVNVEIETTSDLTMGTTLVDWWGVTPRAPNALFLDDIKSDGLFALLTERLARL